VLGRVVFYYVHLCGLLWQKFTFLALSYVIDIVIEYFVVLQLGVDTVPVLVGPVSYLLLSKPAKGVDKTFDLLSLLPKVLAVYK